VAGAPVGPSDGCLVFGAKQRAYDKAELENGVRAVSELGLR
jgi:hypothetical protein